MKIVSLRGRNEERSELEEAVLKGYQGDALRLLNHHRRRARAAQHHQNTPNAPSTEEHEEAFHRAFYYACTYCQLSIVERMLELGADPNTRSSHSESSWVLLEACTRLHQCTIYQNIVQRSTAVIRTLLEAGADPNPGRNSNGHTPLTIITGKKRDVQLLELFLQRGARVDDRFITGSSTRNNNDSFTPLYQACSNSSMAPDMVRLLIEYGANVNATFGGLLETPLHKAAAFGSFEVVQLLLHAGANVNSTTKKETLCREHMAVTPLVYATRFNRDIRVMKLLLESGALVNVQDGDGFSPLHDACRTQNKQLCLAQTRLLLSHDIDVNLRSKYGSSALSTAVCSAYADDLVPILLEHGANPNFQGGAGGQSTTPLHCTIPTAVVSPMTSEAPPKLDVLNALLGAGANPCFVDRNGNTPFDQACKYRHLDCTFILFKAMVGNGYIHFHDI